MHQIGMHILFAQVVSTVQCIRGSFNCWCDLDSGLMHCQNVQTGTKQCTEEAALHGCQTPVLEGSCSVCGFSFLHCT
ncbi:hypothetical protein J4Q44_G00345720 [Coregonus suidteri]|uniref:Secreted protein n=1 Tax=Coregonus suidteri TaxID=861788 RepID=A0AAN8KZ53_9TELE